MASSTKFSLYLIASLLLSSLLVSNVVAALPPPSACKKDIDCVPFCKSVHTLWSYLQKRCPHTNSSHTFAIEYELAQVAYSS
ncbi:hypothetical protein LINGRAHAP2_LOCUS14770 [Linum grandiflorum]